MAIVQKRAMLIVSRKCVKAQRVETGSQIVDVVCMPLT
jgi:hypothetical protein